ncbi:MAG: response regulator [Phyllobacteriaceae bacterium]|nr:response regulator [Phyllobacteriaceae bacterium]
MPSIDVEKDEPFDPRDVVKAVFRLSTLLAVSVLALVWGGVYAYLDTDREWTLDAAVEKTSNIARVFDEYVSNAIKSVDKNLIFLRHARESEPADFDLPAWTTNSYFLRDMTVQMALIGADGFLVSTNVDRHAKHMDLSDREHFRVHAGRSSDELFISKPVLGRATGKWTIQLTRRLSNPDGSFGGVLVASLDPYNLSNFFDRIDLGDGGAITLIGDDGVIRARGGLDRETLGRSIAGTPLHDAMLRSKEGIFRGEGPLGPGERIEAFRHLKDFPLFVTVAENQAEVLAPHLEKRRWFVRSALGVSVVVVALMIIGIGHELRLIQATRKRIDDQRRIARKSQELEATLSRVGQGIVMCDGDGRLRVINRRAVVLLDLASDPVVGEPFPADLVRLFALDIRQDDVRDYQIAGRDVETSTTEMPDGGMLVTLTDITAHRRNAVVLAEARDRAEAATRARTAFLATMSHELRTPLNGVVGTIGLLETEDDTGERALYLRTMRQSAEHLLQIIDDVLDIAKLEADRVTFERRPFEVEDLLQTTTDLVAPLAHDKGLTIETALDPAVPTALYGDAGRLRQVLVNLLGNAVKFTEKGFVFVRVDLDGERRGANGVALRIRVQDTGIGIAAADLGHLFLKFSQLDGSITRRFGGTGLGLAISRELIEKMGGHITVESRLGEGSTFTVVVPLEVASEKAAPASDASPPADVARPGETRTGLDILLAEDNPTNTLVAVRLLENMGHRVTAVADGRAALAALAGRRFDLVLMDVMMPVMDGLTATKLVRSGDRATAGVPIVALTANALAEDREAALEAGADGFVTKPVTAEKLVAALVAVMKKKTGDAANGDRPGDRGAAIRASA